jgi:hypothetical protein
MAPGAAAQELEPRTYSNTPGGLNFLIAGYANVTGGDFDIAGVSWQYRWGGGL